MCSCMPKSDPGFLKNLPPHDRSCGWQHLAAVSDDRHGYAIKKGHEIAARGDSYQRNRKNCMLADFSVLSSCMASFCLNVGTSLCVLKASWNVCICLEVPRLPSWQRFFCWQFISCSEVCKWVRVVYGRNYLYKMHTVHC
jgi:hypothetical protein